MSTITIRHLDNEEQWARLENEFGPLARNEYAFTNLLRFLQHKLWCRAFIEERGYVCKDYRDEYSALYSTTFKEYDSRCVRLHFFKRHFLLEEIGDVGDDDYLGFVVIRPLEAQKVGRTVIRQWLGEGIGDTFYALGSTDFKTHILGKEFNVSGMPFIQQDGLVMVCAHATIWSAARYLSHLYHTPFVYPSKISIYASRSEDYSDKVLPCETLYDTNMVYALRKLGFNTYYSARDDIDCDDKSIGSELLSRCYPYIESRLPVILGVPQHSVLVVGHTFDPNPERVEKLVDAHKEADSELPLILKSEYWVNGLIVHDESQGPYRLLPFDSKARESFQDSLAFKDLLCMPIPKQDSSTTKEDCARVTYEAFSEVESVLVPLPTSVYLLSGYVYSTMDYNFRNGGFIRRLIDGLRDALKTQGGPLYDIYNYVVQSLDPKSNNPIVLRGYLMASIDYKITMREQFRVDHIPEELAVEYEKMAMPQYIWVCEFTTRELLSKENEKERKILGEALIDAKAHKHSSLPFISIHLPGYLIKTAYKGADDYDVKVISVPDDKPYPHHSRMV